MARKINETIKRRVEELSTDWNILVQERIFYPEIFKELNADKEFLQKIELEVSVNYFIHLDSDSLVLRNLFDIYGHFYLDKYFASANLKTVSSARLMAYLNGDVESMCISGGVIVMHFDGCCKPWTNEFQELAKDNSSLQKIIDIYEIFEGGITDPDSVADRSKKAFDILREMNPKEELQKI